MKRVISLSLGSSQQNFDRILSFADQNIHITHLAVDGDEQLLLQLIEDYKTQCDVLAVDGIPAPIILGRRMIRHQLLEQIEKKTAHIPVVTGRLLRTTFSEWAFQDEKNIAELSMRDSTCTFLSGLEQWEYLQCLSPIARDIVCLDPFFQNDLPLALSGLPSLQRYARVRLRDIKNRRPYRSVQFRSLRAFTLFPAIKRALQNDYIVASCEHLRRTQLQDFSGKTLILDEMNSDLRAALGHAGIFNVFWIQPVLKDLETPLPYSVFEALIQLLKASDESLTQDDVLEFISSHAIHPRLQALYPERQAKIKRFAFIIHPLSRRDLFRHPLLKPLNLLPQGVQPWFEKAIAQAPGMLYGHIGSISSRADGSQAEGLIYTLFATPREMLAAEPEQIYQKILAIAEDAKRRGASIIGLGAFTKIVGDAGVSIAQRSVLPVTTGNSLSAAATLWAARDALKSLGFVKLDRDTPGRIEGRVMVIGATGSIGKVCAKILADVFTDLILVAPQGARLMTLRDELHQQSPQCRLLVSTKADRFAGQADLIVIASSATEGGILAIDRIKPGALVCDVGRPLTFTADDALLRPDVLIIESGEIELPGAVQIDCDIGLEASVVYACLAETALLALEGRNESFTLSRNIHYRKVIEIYKLAKKHGARLASIRSPNGIVTPQEIELCREHALKTLARSTTKSD